MLHPLLQELQQLQLHPQPWLQRALSPEEALRDFGQPLRAGKSLLRGTPDGVTPMAVWNFFFQPIL